MSQQDFPANPVNVMHFLRMVQAHHVRLSAMADQKASMLIATCSIILTLIGGYVRSHGFSAPLIIVAVFPTVSVVMGILAATPRNTNFNRHSKNLNPLFFGHFTLLDKDDYLTRMDQIMSTEESLHRAMLDDIFGLGLVLRKKYRLLRVSYLVFLAGFFAAALVGAFSFLFN